MVSRVSTPMKNAHFKQKRYKYNVKEKCTQSFISRSHAIYSKHKNDEILLERKHQNLLKHHVWL